MGEFKIGNMTAEDAEDISALQEMPYWMSLHRFMQAYVERETNATINFPKSSQTDIRQDIKYKLGLIRGLKIALAQPEEAQQLIEREE